MAKPVGHGGRDYPDFGVSDTVQSKSIVTDMGELAARLGAPNVFDRMGNLVWFEQFEYGMGLWTLTTTGNGVTPVLVAYPYLYKPHAVKLAGTSGNTGTSSIAIKLHLPYESALGIEFAFNPDFRATEIEFDGYVYTGSQYLSFGVVFKLKAGTIGVGKQGGGYNTVYTDALGYVKTDSFNIVKLVMDMENGVYKRLMFGTLDIDVKDLAFHVGTSTTRPYLTFLIRLESTADYDESAIIDNIVITLDDPL